MSIRTDPAKSVPALLNRLKSTIETKKDVSSAQHIPKINEHIQSLMRRFPAVKQWQEKLLDSFSALDRHHSDIKDSVSDLSAILKDLDDIDVLLLKLHEEPENNPTDQGLGRHTGQNDNRLQPLSQLEREITQSEDNSVVKCLQVSYDFLDRLDRLDLKICLLFLAIFPEDAVLKKRLLIYWWIGEGLVKDEEEGERKFQELLDLELIIPHRTDKCPRVNKCRIHPWIRYMLITVARRENLLHLSDDEKPCFNPIQSRRLCLISEHKNGSEPDNLRTIFNVSDSYLSHDHQWLAKFKRLVVLHLGRWQASPTHHIEVVNESLLKGLGTQKHLKYLSLRGISRITALPRSIFQLASLEILDLKACHNLETLPDDIESLRKLTHLDVSECYLLESMPKGLDKLTSLQVLKGFMIGNSQKTPCRIEHLRSLAKLERLSIHIGSEAVIQEKEFDILKKELEKLKDLKKVRCLKISWGVAKDDPISPSFPPSLKKLDLEGIPYETMPEWLKPSKLRNLEKLYIKGGKLTSLAHSEAEEWRVKFLLLKYTENLQIDQPTVRKMFRYLEYVKKVRKTKEGDATETSGQEFIDFEWPGEGGSLERSMSQFLP